MSFRFFVILAATFLACSSCTTKSEEADSSHPYKITPDSALYNLSALDKLHKRITFKRKDQSLIAYANSAPNRVDSIRKVIYLLPLGNMSSDVEEILKQEVKFLQTFFQIEVKLLDRVPFDELKNQKVVTRMVRTSDFEYYGKGKVIASQLREQIDAKSLMDAYLRSRIPQDACAVLGISEHDLYQEGMNYIFGTSYLKQRIGIVSSFRIAENKWEAKENLRKVCTKQIVNLFSIANVQDYACVANFHDNIDALRSGTQVLSPVALEKLKYAIGFDYIPRFKALEEFYSLEGDSALMAHYRLSRELLGQKK